MPTYEYACAACDTRHEVQQKMTDASLTDCPACGTSGLRKLFTNVGVVFKGSGFYRNDSRDKPGSGSTSGSAADAAPSAKPSGDSPGTSTGGTSSDASSGSKPDSASTSKPATTSGSSSPSKTPAAASA